MGNADTPAEIKQNEDVKSPEKPIESVKTTEAEEKSDKPEPDATEPSENKPTQNGETEESKTPDTLENKDETTKPEDKPVEENNTESKDKPVEENNTEAKDKPVEEKTTEAKDKPVEEKTTESNDKPPDKPVKITRGTKRKAANNIENEAASGPKEVETVEQKENVDSKNDNNVQKENDLSAEDSSMRSVPDSLIMGKGKRARIPNKRYSDIILSPNRKSIGNNPKPPDTGDFSEITVKEEPLDSPVVSAVTSPSLPTKKARSSQVKENLQDPKYLKPFKFGWKRELVWRSTSTAIKPLGDIYYYTPAGKKVRSFREVSDHLTGKNLTLENFSFTKEPLGIDDTEKEIIREAKIKSSESFSESPQVKKPEIKKTLVKKVLSPKSGGAASPRGASAASTKVDTPPVKKKAEPAVVKEKETPPPKATPKKTPTPVNKMPLRRTTRTPAPSPAKKAKVTSKVEETPKKIETPPPPPVTRSVSSPNKVTRATPNSVSKLKKRNLKVKSITNTNSITVEEKNEAKFMENYMQNLSFGYNTLLYVFQYLKVQDLLRAGCVCTMWRDIASHPILWRTVRMKNSQVHSFEGLANTLKRHGTVHLDLRKMLLPSNGDEIWPEFSKAIAQVDTLKKIELCRCPASVVEQLATSNPTLQIINAVTIKCENMDLDPLKSLTNIKELRLKSTSGLNINSIDSLKDLKTLKILSLTSVNELHKLDLTVIAELTNLESLDLGECTEFPKNFGQNILSKLEKLEKLRLEKGQGNCHTFEILEAVKHMKKMEQLELVNFDVKAGFDKAIGSCTNIRKLMIIPTYISQSATTNNMVLAGVLRLQGSLTHFVWGVTLELLRVTELFVDQCEDSNKKEKKPTGNGDSIPVLKPVPDLTHGGDIQTASNPPQVEILPLPNLQKLLLNSLPTTRVKILKIPFHATWRQTLTDSV